MELWPFDLDLFLYSRMPLRFAEHMWADMCRYMVNMRIP